MGNTCCQKPEEQFVMTTMEDNKKEEEEIKMDKYPHDSDSAFKSLKKGEKKFEIKPLSTDNIIEE